MIFKENLPKAREIPLDLVQMIEHMRGCVKRETTLVDLEAATGIAVQQLRLFRRGATTYPGPVVINALIKHYLPDAKLVVPVMEVAASSEDA